MPTTVLWRWRYETAGTAGGSLLWWTCVRAGTGLATMSTVTALLAFAALVGPIRRWLFALAWCVVTPHRIRVGCAEAGVVSHAGRLPAVLFTTRRAHGERVYVRCPDGMAPGDLAAARRAIAAACWATDVQVFTTAEARPRFVALDVVRTPAPIAALSTRIGDRIQLGAATALHSRLDRHARRTTPTPGT